MYERTSEELMGGYEIPIKYPQASFSGKIFEGPNAQHVTYSQQEANYLEPNKSMNALLFQEKEMIRLKKHHECYESPHSSFEEYVYPSSTSRFMTRYQEAEESATSAPRELSFQRTQSTVPQIHKYGNYLQASSPGVCDQYIPDSLIFGTKETMPSQQEHEKFSQCAANPSMHEDPDFKREQSVILESSRLVSGALRYREEQTTSHHEYEHEKLLQPTWTPFHGDSGEENKITQSGRYYAGGRSVYEKQTAAHQEYKDEKYIQQAASAQFHSYTVDCLEQSQKQGATVESARRVAGTLKTVTTEVRNPENYLHHSLDSTVIEVAANVPRPVAGTSSHMPQNLDGIMGLEAARSVATTTFHERPTSYSRYLEPAMEGGIPSTITSQNTTSQWFDPNNQKVQSCASYSEFCNEMISTSSPRLGVCGQGATRGLQPARPVATEIIRGRQTISQQYMYERYLDHASNPQYFGVEREEGLRTTNKFDKQFAQFDTNRQEVYPYSASYSGVSITPVPQFGARGQGVTRGLQSTRSVVARTFHRNQSIGLQQYNDYRYLERTSNSQALQSAVERDNSATLRSRDTINQQVRRNAPYPLVGSEKLKSSTPHLGDPDHM